MVKTEVVEYHADGARLVSYAAYDSDIAGVRPGILVAPEGGGLGLHAKERAERLAQLGYVALAVDLYGDGAPAADMAKAMAWIAALTSDLPRLRARIGAGLAALKANPLADASRIAALGYCFGGTAALELARSGADVLGTLCFHGVLKTTAPKDAANIKGKVIAFVGSEDPLIPPDQRQAFEAEMRGGNIDWQMVVYGRTRHSFTNMDADRMGWDALAYNQLADERAWAAMRLFLSELFNRP